MSTGAAERGMFRALAVRNYRIWAAGAFISNIGTWMQRTGQDWLVLAELTHHDAAAVGLVMALQFGPQILLFPLSGLAADRFDRRRVLLATQAVMGMLALGLGLLTVTGLVRLWEVDLFALLLGCTSAFDAPARQTFVSELVGDEQLANAVALNSTSFNAGRTIGPAVAGLLTASIGSGWVFVLNGASFLGVLAALCMLRVSELHRPDKRRETPRLLDGFRYLRGRPDLRIVLVMLFLIGTFGLNFAIYISTMSVRTFGAGARAYGLLTSAMAVGSVSAALLAARRGEPRLRLLVAAAALFGTGCLLAALSPSILPFGAFLLLTGMAAQTFTTSANSLVQLTTEPAMRGRMIALLLAIAVGGTPLGAPLVGWVANAFGPRWAMGVGAAAGLAAALVGLCYRPRLSAVSAACPAAR